MTIQFSKLNGPYGAFSNFAKYPIKLDKVWPSVEHFYQGMKFTETKHLDRIELIREAKSAYDAAKLGRDPKFLIRPDWDNIHISSHSLTVKEKFMLMGQRAKFTQHKALGELLLSTGDQLIVERSDRDAYWGDGLDGEGLNKCGFLLMIVRSELATADFENKRVIIAQQRLLTF